MYSFIFRHFLRKMDPELAHSLAGFFFFFLSIPVFTRMFRRKNPAQPPFLPVETLGHTFSHPFGLAAGFDKDGKYLKAMAVLGFSHVEVGTVTPVAQSGNPKPRLFRVSDDQALINRMGFNNQGALALRRRIETFRSRHSSLIIGVNIGKQASSPVEHAVDDYVTCARILAPVSDYLAVNVSSPNTRGLRDLQRIPVLEPLLEQVKTAASGKPVLVKISPDLDDEQIRDIALLVRKIDLAGIIACNTTLDRGSLTASEESIQNIGNGGLSGVPLQNRSKEILAILRDILPPDFCVISVGGVDSRNEIEQRIAFGATLVQGYTAFIYHGPMWVKKMFS